MRGCSAAVFIGIHREGVPVLYIMGLTLSLATGSESVRATGLVRRTRCGTGIGTQNVWEKSTAEGRSTEIFGCFEFVRVWIPYRK